MTAQQIIEAIEAEPAHLFFWAYAHNREELDEQIADQLENGNPVEFAQRYLATVRRAMLHALQHVDAPEEVIEKVFA